MKQLEVRELGEGQELAERDVAERLRGAVACASAVAGAAGRQVRRQQGRHLHGRVRILQPERLRRHRRRWWRQFVFASPGGPRSAGDVQPRHCRVGVDSNGGRGFDCRLERDGGWRHEQRERHRLVCDELFG